MMLKAAVWGFLGGLSLLTVYLVVMGWGSGSFLVAWQELVRLKWWFTGLILGFSIQIGLFSYIKSYQNPNQFTGGVVASSTTTSTVAMIACCAHHLTDILPLLGISVAAAFLAKYQQYFLAVGILSNLVGVIIMFRHLQKIKGKNEN